jgi:hypothetical protein
LLGLLLLGLAVTGCSTFNRDWKAAASIAAPANDITGRWEGTWQSEATGHHGKLRSLVTHLEGGDYQARYRAKYLRIMSFSYPVRLKVVAAEDGFKFNGEADLGWYAGGLYQYEGRALGEETRLRPQAAGFADQHAGRRPASFQRPPSGHVSHPVLSSPVGAVE